MVVSKSAFPDPQGYFVTETHQKYNHLSFTSKQDIMLTMLWKPPEVVDCNRICVRETLCKESRQKKNVSTGSAAFFPPFFILISSGTLNASQQQATSSWVNGTELILPQTPTAISTELCMDPQLAFFQEAAKDLIVSESNFCWPQSH